MCLLSGSFGMNINFTTKEKNGRSQYRQWIVAFIATLTLFTCGLQIGWVSPYIALLQSDKSPSGYPLSDTQISWIASAISVLAMFSAVMFSLISDAFGRRLALIIIAVNQMLGFGLKLLSADLIILMISQGLCGIATGGVYCVAPAYIKEISEDSLRGILNSVGIILSSLGTAIMYTMGSYMAYYTALWILVWVPIVNVIGLLLIPESPSILVMKRKVEEATQVMAWTRGVDINEKTVRRDISLEKKEKAAFENLPPISIETVLADKASRKAICLSFLMITMLELGGYYVFLMYASVIINNAGVAVGHHLQAISFPVLMAIGSFASTLTIEKFGRKPLIVASAILAGVSLAAVGAAILFQNQGIRILKLLPLLCIGLCLFANGLETPIPFIVISEMFTTRLRSIILGVLVTYGWFLCALQTLIFPIVSKSLGMHSMFFIFAFANFFGIWIFIITMPETKGKTSEEISKELEEN